ncbi:MAG: gliding motility-associated C-terminal domain-containing protein [Tannerella sp.]|jgi:gliding motility-associated-like protein|nr:gliding motility-associated C-terminal domain-containing protein [Tannerella sp.]
MRKLYHFCLLCLACLAAGFSPLRAQWTVSGGNGKPLLALDDTPDRLQVWLVNGLQGVRLQYEGAGTAGQWRRYSQKALDAVPVTGVVQEGAYSVLNQVQEGCAYFVGEPDVNTRYVWIIDYSKHAFSISNLQVDASSDPCESLRLEGKADIPALTYYTPLGMPQTLTRVFDVSYNTLEWDEASLSFLPKVFSDSIAGDPFSAFLPAPLCDTEVRLTGDRFAEHFGMESSATTPLYTAVAVEAHIDTTFTASDGTNLAGEGSGLSAPVAAHFRAVANDPVPTYFRWTIYNTKTGETPISYPGQELDYTFQKAGNYVARMDVGSSTCQVSDSISIQISESALYVPNAFSPGASPGVNDVFKVAYKSLVRFHAHIFNRWGQEIYSWNDPAGGWDGKRNGHLVPSGVYFYIIEATGSDGVKYLKKGDINILRPKDATESE